MPHRNHRFHSLRHKWTKRHHRLRRDLWDRHGEAMAWLHDSSKQLMLASMAGLLLLTRPVSAAPIAPSVVPTPPMILESKTHDADHLKNDLKAVLPQTVDPLSAEQEQHVATVLSRYFGVSVWPELEGKRLNRSYGLIGAEQHLMRYPGDTMASHFATPEEAVFAPSGMAPGRGAWGYFADSAGSMTQQDIDREKYYVAVQTFLAPGWNDDVNGHYQFFKHRKMLVVNPENGKAVVAVIGDAGPAPFTGKHLGGSPEVMGYLERQDGGARGPVIYMFIDDPADAVPLGPIQIH